ncbi:pyrimidine 5'-nucleotidase [Beijerinckia indica]|uniref:pyrimidine 5'-nucleotidase n=1 Tax=Beijerinckia indica TaxID=533 RepID=UPI0005A1BC35|nr:pyrimidine 5'-nucleotidase [Beijerinckia indica]
MPSHQNRVLAHVETFVFDLDNTLYPSHCDLWPKIDARITLYMMHHLGLDGLSSRALQKHYYHHYGTTLRGLMQEDAVGAEDFLAFVHDIDRSSLPPNPTLADAITRLPGRKLILTNGSRDHALNTAKALGLEALFEDVFDIADADFVPKPHPTAYERFFDKHAVDPARAVMFEDLTKNLLIPHQRGMKTVLVVPKPGQLDHRDKIEIAGREIPPHIDYVTDDLESFLLGLLEDATNKP